MKGEHRFDLKEILSTCHRGEYLVYSYFKIMDYNDILFRDLYDFFDSEEIKLYCCVEPIYHNHNLFWAHNIVKDIDDDDVIYSEESKKPYTTPTYFTEKRRFENRRDAEIEMFFLAFRKLEKLLSDPERSKAQAKKIHNITTNTTTLYDAYYNRDNNTESNQ